MENNFGLYTTASPFHSMKSNQSNVEVQEVSLPEINRGPHAPQALPPYQSPMVQK